MNQSISASVLESYERLQSRLADVATSTQRKLESVLGDPNLNIHSITNRIKTKQSLKRKIERPDRTYGGLLDVTDVVGFRIVTYFEDSIEQIGQLIELNFEVDFKNSTNKLRSSDHERFGYRSMHYVCFDVAGERFRFEIQIRTVLQHAWAEIEHDLGYKSPDGIPGVIRRRFSQVASILEIADREFVSIRRDVSQYQSALSLRGVENDHGIPLDLVSLEALLAHDHVRTLDDQLALLMKISLGETAFYPEYLLRALKHVELRNVGEAFEAIAKYRTRLAEFVPLYFKFAQQAMRLNVASIESVHRGYALLFVAHLAMLDRDALTLDKANRAAKFYQDLDYPDAPADAANVSRTLVDTLQAAGFFATTSKDAL